MATRTIIWTALPNGISGNNLPLLSVHIAPRLVPTGPGDGQLQDFSEWQTWPNTALTSWTVEFGSGEQIGANVVTSPAFGNSTTQISLGKIISDNTTLEFFSTNAFEAVAWLFLVACFWKSNSA